MAVMAVMEVTVLAMVVAAMEVRVRVCSVQIVLPLFSKPGEIIFIPSYLAQRLGHFH